MSQPLLASLFDATERLPLTVSQLTASIRVELEKRFASVWVEGEISNFRAHGSGHWYFTLKDEFAQMRAACYRSSNQRIRFRPEAGLQVRVRGRLSVYEPKGEYQLIAEAIEPVGAGALQLAFEQTKARLQAQGLFAENLKRAIPMFPRRVGIVISAVGHETDFTIVDFVADLRAPTPSAAAEIVAAHEAQLCSLLERLTANLARSIRYRIADARTHVQDLALSPAFDAVASRLHA